MYINLTKNPLFYLSLILAVIVGFQTWSLVQAGTFAEPTSAFPTSDVSAPVETGEVAQTKYETLSFAPVGAPSDVWISVGPRGLGLYNGGSLTYASTWDFLRVWNGPDANGTISYTGGVSIQREGGLSSMEIDSDGNVDIAGSLTTGSPSEIWIGREDVIIDYLCDGYRLYGEHNMNCVKWDNITTPHWETAINKCVKNMRLYLTSSVCDGGSWPNRYVSRDYEDHTSGVAFNVWNVNKNTITVTVWRDSSKDNTAIGCKFVTKIKIDGVHGFSGDGWIKGYLIADEIWKFDTLKFGN